MEVRQIQRRSHSLDSHHMGQESGEEDSQSDAWKCKSACGTFRFDSTDTNLYLVAGESFVRRGGYSGA